MSTEFTPLSVNEPSSAPVASTEQDALPIASTDSGAAPAPTPAAEEKPAEGVGLANLRGHVKNLESDLAKYKSEVERYKAIADPVEKRGGLEAAQPAYDLYDSMSVINPAEFDASGVLEKMWDAHPDNAWRTLVHAVDEIPELREYVMSKYGNGAAAQASQPAIQDPNANPQNAPFYDESDPVQVAWKRSNDELRAELNELKARVNQGDEVRRKAEVEQSKHIHAQRIEEHVDGKLRPILKSAVEGLQGWSETDIGRVMTDIEGNLNKNQTYVGLYKDAQDAAKIGARGALLQIMPKLRDVVAHQIKNSVEYFSNRLGASPQRAVGAQTARREISNTGAATAAQPVEKAYKSNSLLDEEFRNDLAADLEAQFGGRR